MKEFSKTYVFDKNFAFLKAFPSQLEAMMKTKKSDCFFFSKSEVKKQKHIKLFKDLVKFQATPERKKALAKLLASKKRVKK